jgi:hypothetical protein
MIEAYSNNITVATDATVPFINVNIQKGCTAKIESSGTIELNKAGIYMVTVDAAGTPSSDGDMSIQLYKNGIAQPQAQSIVDGTTTAAANMSFTTLVQVKDNNTCSCCTSPTFIRVVNTGVPVVYAITNIVVTKIC